MTGKILITGGAGYIGSHTVRQLGEAGESLVTLDNLSTGFRDKVLYGDFVEGDTADPELVNSVIAEHQVETVIHFAAHTIVPESVSDPLKYYRNNTCATRNLLECSQNNGVKNFIFSSTAAVYGTPDQTTCFEDTPTHPINPYGMSKLMSEHMIRDVSQATDMRHVILRYFNVAGSDPQGRIGQCTPNATLLIKVAAEVALGKRQELLIFGTDYDTEDGTGVRDYIHVEDLADAHLKALDHLRAGGESSTLNCGYGHGFSVKDVVQMVEEVTGKPLPVREVARRAGDPPMLIAGARRIREELGWTPRYDDLRTIVHSSLEWESKLD
ncbi:MAG: UDP-glucose 4-epimerase GalE [bacterium]